MTRMQRTIRTPIEFSGVGLHSGLPVKGRMLPAPQDTGVEFVRTDLPDASPIPARISHRSAMDRRTRLEKGAARVDTVEHLLSVCYGLGLDNLRVELNGQEVPGLDGSALSFVNLIQQAGLVEQRAEVKVLRLTRPIYVREGPVTLVALPSEATGLSLEYFASFDEPGVESGSMSIDITPESFIKEIA
ncbi:MAG TPA: UDP-3-O-acyl-N-acetylglucosamine deacetylase, partial [Planctomycetota bacterium]|nr:UDP-3-O-acyl-N-acetylglucosamine deacetylase [Planctomycetota bacterium]